MCFLSKALKISSDLSPLKSCRHITVYPDSKKKVLMLLTSHLSSIRFVSLAGLCVNQLSLLLQVMAVWFLSTVFQAGNPKYPAAVCAPYTQCTDKANALVPLPDMSLSESRSFCCMISQMDRMLYAICMNLCYWCWEPSAFLQCATGDSHCNSSRRKSAICFFEITLGTGLGKKSLQNKKHTDI